MLLGALGLAGLLALQACQDKPPPAAPAAPEVAVVTLAPQRVSLKTELPGRTVAAERAEIRPQVNGIIQARLFEEGTPVPAGQALFQIDPASYRMALDSAQAAVAKAEAAVQAAQSNARRQQQLLASDATSRQEVDDAQATLRQAQAELQAAKAAAATAALDLSRTRITAPIAGRVDTSTVTAGALVTANQTTALTTVQQTDPMWVDIPQSSADRLRLREQIEQGALEGGELSIRLVLENGSVYRHAGVLKVGGTTVDTGTGAVTLRARVPNPDGLLMPGMYVRAVIEQAEDPDALMAPMAGIQRDARGGATALVVGADGKVAQRSVIVAEAVGNAWRVTSGLSPGDRVVVEGAGKVRPGQAVQVVQMTQAPAAAAASPSASAPSVAPVARVAQAAASAPLQR